MHSINMQRLCHHTSKCLIYIHNIIPNFLPISTFQDTSRTSDHCLVYYRLFASCWIMSCILLLVLFTCYAATEPGVPYNVTVRARTAAGKGEPVSLVVFAVQQGNAENGRRL